MDHFKRTHAVPRCHVLQFPHPGGFLVGSAGTGTFFCLLWSGSLLDPIVEGASSERSQLAHEAFLRVSSIYRSGGSVSRGLKLFGYERIHQLASRLWRFRGTGAAPGDAGGETNIPTAITKLRFLGRFRPAPQQAPGCA